MVEDHSCSPLGHHGRKMTPRIRQKSTRAELPWDSAGTLAPLEFILNPAPRMTLLKPKLNHVTCLYKTRQWLLILFGIKPKTITMAYKALHAPSCALSPVSSPTLLLSAHCTPGFLPDTDLLAVLQTHPEDPCLWSLHSLFPLPGMLFPSNSWFTLSLHLGLSSNATSSEKPSLSTCLKHMRAGTSSV